MKYLLAISLGMLSMLLFNHCITPVDSLPETERRLLVVEGGITSKLGPHRIQISRSARYGSRAVGEIEPIRNADVWLRDLNGTLVFLEEEISGNYLTPANFKAEVGNKYSLFITLENGERFASTPAEVMPGPELDEVIPKFVEQPSLENDKNVGVELFAKFKDPAGERNFYFWETKGEYALSTRPDLHAVPDGQGGEIIVPLGCCALCYLNEGGLGNQLNIFTDIFTNGQQQEKRVAYIQDDGLRFLDTYMAVVEQYSLTKDAYAFFEVLAEQLEISGDIFDPPPASLNGNIINLDQPDEETIGYFWAASMVNDTIFIKRSLLTNPAPAVIIRDDCRGIRNSFTEKPDYWP